MGVTPRKSHLKPFDGFFHSDGVKTLDVRNISAPAVSRWAMPIAGRLAPFQGLECRHKICFYALKGINRSAQGIALRHPSRPT